MRTLEEEKIMKTFMQIYVKKNKNWGTLLSDTVIKLIWIAESSWGMV